MDKGEKDHKGMQPLLHLVVMRVAEMTVLQCETTLIYKSI